MQNPNFIIVGTSGKVVKIENANNKALAASLKKFRLAHDPVVSLTWLKA